MCGSSCSKCGDKCSGRDWKSAITEELALWGLTPKGTELTPKEALQVLIDWHVSVALDPEVSDLAKDLVESEFEQVGRVRSTALSEVGFNRSPPPPNTPIYIRK